MKLKLFLIALVGLLYSCNTNEIYSELDRNFEANRWLKTATKEFNFENAKSEEIVAVKLHFAHVHGYQFEEIPLEVEFINPKGISEIIALNLKVKDANGKDVGNCSGDICDVIHTIKTNVKLEKGTYTLKIKNTFSSEYLPNVLGIGVIFEKMK